MKKLIYFLILLIFMGHSPLLEAKTKEKSTISRGKKLKIKNYKKQYWTQGGDLDVVQNRAYRKARKVEFGVFGGFVGNDPFLNINNVGGLLGYHFNETFQVSLMGWKNFTRASSALNEFETQTGRTTNTNIPEWYGGGEVGLSVLYGKLSLLGKAIIYYDLHLLGGLGITSTESGNNLTPSVGIGQNIYLNQTFSIRIDYRKMFYQETVIEKHKVIGRGKAIGTRGVFTDAFSLGVSLLF